MHKRIAHRLRLGGLVAGGVALALAQIACSGDNYYYNNNNNGAYPVTTVAVGDLNGDGRIDIVDSIYFTGDTAMDPGWVSSRIQNATTLGSYDAPVQNAAGTNPANLVVAMLSTTGNPGVVVANLQLFPAVAPANTVSVLYPDPNVPGGFKTPVALPLGARNPAGVAVADLTGDGLPDVVVAADGANTLLLFAQQAPGGTFAAPVPLTVGGVPTAVAIGDVDGDGFDDLVVATGASTVSVLIQNPAAPGTFKPYVDYPVGSSPVAVALADLGDGHLSILTANYGTALNPTTKGLSILMQAATAGTFQAATTLDTGDSYSSGLAVGDLLGQGRLDIAVANQGLPGNPGSVSVFLHGAAPGAFQAPTGYKGVFGPSSVAIGDIDGDGKPDLVIGDSGLFVRYQSRTAAGTFGLPYQFRQ